MHLFISEKSQKIHLTIKSAIVALHFFLLDLLKENLENKKQS